VWLGVQHGGEAEESVTHGEGMAPKEWNWGYRSWETAHALWSTQPGVVNSNFEDSDARAIASNDSINSSSGSDDDEEADGGGDDDIDIMSNSASQLSKTPASAYTVKSRSRSTRPLQVDPVSELGESLKEGLLGFGAAFKEGFGTLATAFTQPAVESKTSAKIDGLLQELLIGQKEEKAERATDREAAKAQQQESNNLLSELVQIHKGEREEKAREKQEEAQLKQEEARKQELLMQVLMGLASKINNA
jgi:hypothetical protein